MASRPGRIIETIPVAIERPRLRASVLAPEFLAIKERCIELLTPGGPASAAHGEAA
jgi:hypothetical protein